MRAVKRAALARLATLLKMLAPIVERAPRAIEERAVARAVRRVGEGRGEVSSETTFEGSGAGDSRPEEGVAFVAGRSVAGGSLEGDSLSFSGAVVVMGGAASGAVVVMGVVAASGASSWSARGLPRKVTGIARLCMLAVVAGSE